MRQNTPHPRELKAKAHKLFGKGQNSIEEHETHQEPIVEAVNHIVPEPKIELSPPSQGNGTGTGTEDTSEPSDPDDTDDVSPIYTLQNFIYLFSNKFPSPE